jgi:hypothetical protein
MTKKVIRLTESDLTRIVKRVIAEQEEGDYKRGIQCFLNKRGIKDDSGQSLKIDGLIGNYPASKTAQAISNYQSKIGVYPADGVWGEDTMRKMPSKDKEMFKQCVSDYGDIFDKGAHWLGLD